MFTYNPIQVFIHRQQTILETSWLGWVSEFWSLDRVQEGVEHLEISQYSY